MKKFNAGMLLIADPFLQDNTFKRSVILLCEVQAQNATGFMLNRLYHKSLNQLISDINHIQMPVYYGGPVQLDSLHFLHTRPDLINESFLVTDNIYWGGNFEEVLFLLKNNFLTNNDIRFFIGYSGWDNNQLANEFEDKTWFIHLAKNAFVFNNEIENIWKTVLKDMGGEFALIANYPTNPQLN